MALTSKERQARYRDSHREQCRAANRKWSRENRHKTNEARRVWRRRNPDKFRDYMRRHTAAWRLKNPEKVREINRRSRAKHRIAHNERVRLRARALKLEVITRYGETCACCGERVIEFLTIDHVNNDGAAHRRSLANSRAAGSGFYAWLKRNNWPSGFQVLCYNCNCAKGFFGICPHQRNT